MIRQIFVLLWNKKTSNLLLLLEIFLAFLALFAVYSYVIKNVENYGRPPGFSTENRWLVLIDAKDVDSTKASTMYPLLKKTLASDQNVLEAGLINSVYPFGGSWSQTGDDDAGFEIRMRYSRADANIGKALAIEMVGGRWFEEGEELQPVESMIVNQEFIDLYYPNQNMVDSTILFSGKKKIIGIIKDYKYLNEFEEPYSSGFFYNRPGDMYLSNLILKMKPGTPAAYQENIIKVVENITGNNRSVIQDLDEMRIEKSKGSWTAMVFLLALCGFLCLNIALGLFGLLWYGIQKRRSEIGLRRALGAHSTDITTQLVLEMVILVSMALFLGVIFAIQVPILKLIPMESEIFYRAIFWAFCSILGIVFLCTIYPSMQASEIHPATALHED